MDNFEAVIGLEVHAQLATDSKIFATSSTQSGNLPNTQTDPVTLGLPGCLPVLNKRVVDFAIKLGVATNCKIRHESVFARKHYFYPDLPKGYQISQYDKPLCEDGYLEIRSDTGMKRICITRIHLEEDAGKNTHLDHEPYSVVDLNRAGVPLVEIVSEPDLRSAQEAAAYMKLLRQTVRYLDICDGNMDEGSLRCDANVSVRLRGAEKLGTKVEIKNLNSFKFVERAIEYEIARQSALLANGEAVVQETRLWDESKGATRSMRGKEEAADYRYFPDPDLLPLVVDEAWIERIQSTLPELPGQAFDRFRSNYGLSPDQCELLTEEKLTAHYFDQAASVHNNPQGIANWITSELFGRLNRDGMAMSRCPISPQNLANLVKLIDDEVISGKIAKAIFEEMFSSSTSPASIVEKRGLRQITDSNQISTIIKRVLDENPAQVIAFREGKTKMMGFFVGQIMKETGGKANPQLVNELLTKELA